MQKTKYYGLNKPEKTDFYNIEDMNENMEKLDKELKEHTHNYAGSSSVGGSATSAEKLTTARKINGVEFDGSKDVNISKLHTEEAIGSSKQPVYFNEKGEPIVADEISEKLVNEATDKLENSLAGASLVYLKDAGYTSQNGTPTPTAPIEVVGVGGSGTIDIVTCGKNLLSPTLETSTQNGVTCTKNNDGTYTLSGANNGSGDSWFVFGLVDIPKGTYRLLGCPPNGSDTTYMLELANNSTGMSVFESRDVGSGKTFDVEAGKYKVMFCVRKGISISSIIRPILALEPYEETKASIPIDAPLYDGDYIEIFADGSGEIYRQYKKTTLKSSSEWTYNSSQKWFGIYVYDCKKSLGTDNCKSTHYAEYVGEWRNMPNGKIQVAENCLRMHDDRFDNVADFKAWLDTETVEVVYKLKEPTRTPLTAEQIAEFKKLHTFNGTTYVNADGTATVRYYCNSDGGDTVRMLHEMVENKNHVESADTATVALSAMSADHARTSSCADRLSNTKAIGSASKPVYFKDGVPVECSTEFVTKSSDSWEPDITIIEYGSAYPASITAEYVKIGNMVYIECVLRNIEDGLDSINGIKYLPLTAMELCHYTDSDGERIYVYSSNITLASNGVVKPMKVYRGNNSYSIKIDGALTADDKVAVISGWYMTYDD